MILQIGLENNMDGRSVAWALDFPGCFSDGKDGSAALLGVPQAFIKHLDWADRHAPNSWLSKIGNFDVRLVETFDCTFINPATYELVGEDGIEIDAWFRHDWKPLSMQEARRGQQLLEWSRADLLTAVVGLSAAQLDAVYPGERWSIRGVLEHISLGEWYYLNSLDLVSDLPVSQLPPDPLARLEVVRKALTTRLPNLAGSRQVVGKAGEFWSPRKLLRRALWHELDHIGHIYKLLLF
jgi:hypothetical protein